MINLFDIKHAIKERDSLDGLWIGTVKETVDPMAQHRIRVEVDELTTGIPIKDLPWYLVMRPADASANSATSLPRVGSRVLVQFFHGDIYNGIVMGAINITPTGAVT